MNTEEALRALGWDGPGYEPVRAVQDFQRGYALGPALRVDGKPGPKTRASLMVAVDRLEAGRPTASEHFSFREFACRCGGRYPRCRVQVVHRGLLLGLEAYRDVRRGPVSIVSGYRCPQRNAEVGGASNSQHVYGAAADLDYALSDRQVLRLRAFSGIGRSRSSRKVRHVDVRHLAGNNTTQGTPDRPTVWDYAR